MIQFKDKIFIGAAGRCSLFDVQLAGTNRALVIFVHGYKGYKDWGAWNLVESYFVEKNFGFMKFNMSHNGGTVEDPIDFPDLEAFGNNCYSYELHDLNVIIDEAHRLIHQELEADIPIYLMGHSRGGGMAVLAGYENDKVSKIVSLAGICDIEMRFPDGEELKEWRNKEVKYVLNGRTNQQMPHYYSFYEDFDRNRKRLNIEHAATQLSVPFLQVHGDMDVSVSITEGMNLAAWTKTDLKIIKGAEHTFGTKHPWEQEELPEEMIEALEAVCQFYDS